MASITLKAGREKSVVRRHPWIFSGAIERVDGNPQTGETVEICSNRKVLLGRGAYSPASQIRVRAWTFDPDTRIEKPFFRNRLQKAVELRASYIKGSNPRKLACRLVHSESDGLPGVIIDRYGDFLVCQFLTAGAEYFKQIILEQVVKLAPFAGVYERSDVDERRREGLPEAKGVLWGSEPPELVEIQEVPYHFLVDCRNGQKTGFFLDQRENRALVSKYAKETEVLNCFSYTGGFGVCALGGGATSVVNVDSSASALELAARNFKLNKFDMDKVRNIEGDAFKVLREFRDSNRFFDLIILDPPKFADSRNSLDGACRGYKDINLQAFKILKPGGALFTFSCSGILPGELFQKIVADAALDAGCDARIMRWLHQGTDHPTMLSFPEANYLKGLVCRV